MKNKRGMTICEKIRVDLEIARETNDAEHRRLLAYMAISAAELAVDFNLITYREWDKLTQEAFNVM